MNGSIMTVIFRMAALIAAGFAAGSAAADTVRLEQLGGNAAVLIGESCNVVVVRSDAGLLLIDNQRSGDYPATRDLLDQAYHQPVVEVINTHWHADHSGGNEAFAKAGATIVAQDNVGVRLSRPQYMPAYRVLVPAAAPIALPRRGFAHRMIVRFGEERLRLLHTPNAHTDGDTLVKLERANVLHMGDLFFNGYYPFIDLGSGGSIQGLIRAVDAGLRMSDGRTRIVPGHGPVASRKELAAYRAMLVAVARQVRGEIARGRSLAVILADKPAAGYPLEGEADRFVTAVYEGQAGPRRSGAKL